MNKKIERIVVVNNGKRFTKLIQAQNNPRIEDLALIATHKIQTLKRGNNLYFNKQPQYPNYTSPRTILTLRQKGKSKIGS